ncbi:MAG: hypothetical protein Q9M36_15805 [Sulfurovum sp.]|nr:hypothetical protein [Sulfurovum sp.]
MDKMKKHTRFTASKEGFALMITLSVLSVVIALTVVLLSYFNEVKEDAQTTKALIQGNVYYADILEQFSKFKNKKSLFSQLYLRAVSLNSPDGRFSLSLSCKPLSSGININWLAMDRNKEKQHLFQESQILFDFLSEAYKIEDPDRLLELILLEIGQDKTLEKEDQRRLIQKNGIISYAQLSEIINRYEMEVDDQKVALIPWGQYFSFSKTSEKIDIEYSSIAFISFLFDMSIQSVTEWKYAREKISLANFVSQNGGDFSAKKRLFAGNTFLAESSV